MFQGSRSRLLAYYLIVMAAILCLFSAALYLSFSRSLYHQLDTSLQTLAKVAAPSLIEIRTKDDRDFQQVDRLPWREIFKPKQQSIEWFDDRGQLLASQGKLKLFFAPKIGLWTLKPEKTKNSADIRTFTLLVTIDRSSLNQPSLQGYIRSSQSTEELQEDKQQFLWQLGISAFMTLGVVAVGGIWLTKKALEPVERSFNQLRQFTADASHELRSPLTAIKTSIDVMQNHPERFVPKDMKKLAAIANATGQMTHLTQDLLLLARTEGTVKSAEGELHSVALHHLLQDIVDLLEPVAQDKQIVLEYRCLAKLTVIGDPAQLNRLFANLLENALQYTPPEGRVFLRLAQQNHLAVVSVEDTGIGIALENLPLVFDRFWRADRARAYREGGTGLGLAIAQAIAKRHGGQITVSSQVGVGSCFQVSLPMNKSERRQKKPRSFWRTFNSLPDLTRKKPTGLLKKLALLLITIILGIFPFILVKEVSEQIYTFHGMKFPDGAASFVDEVVVYQAVGKLDREGLSAAKQTFTNPSATLGIPDFSTLLGLPFFGSDRNDVVLRQGDSITLQFTDNLLTGSGDPSLDLWIFIAGDTKASLSVEISKDGASWSLLDSISQPQSGIDIDRFGYGVGDFFSYVRLTNELKNGINASKQEVNIDAVGAVSSARLAPSVPSFLPLANPLARILLLTFLTFAVGYGVSYWFKKKN